MKDVTFLNDVRIILKTIKLVFARQGISSKDSATMTKFTGNKIKDDKKEEK